MLDPPGLGPLAPSPTLHAPRLSSPAVRRRHMAGAKLGRAQRPGVKSETLMSFVSPPTAADNEVLCARGPAQSGPCGRLRTVTPRGVFLPVPRACKLLTRLQTAYPPWRRGLRTWDFVYSRELWEWP